MSSRTPKSDAKGDSGGKTNWAAIDAMTECEAEASADTDPDCPPVAPGRMLHKMSPAKRIRLKLGLSLKEFAARYRIPLATLVAWERHEAKPDAVAVAFLEAIGNDPAGLARALSQSSGRPAAAE